MLKNVNTLQKTTYKLLKNSKIKRTRLHPLTLIEQQQKEIDELTHFEFDSARIPNYIPNNTQKKTPKFKCKCCFCNGSGWIIKISGTNILTSNLNYTICTLCNGTGIN